MTAADYQALVDDLTRHEGLRLKVYFDSLGVASIGFGRNLRDVGISNAEAHVMLDHDIERAHAEAQTFAWFAGLTPGRQRAIVNLLFNMGLPRFLTFRKMIHALAVGDYVVAAQELRSSQWAHQVQPTRVADLSHLLEQG
jgi:lysozyme